MTTPRTPQQCLKDALEGTDTPLYWPGTREYNQTLRIDNKRAVVLPLAVVAPQSKQHIVNAMNASQLCNVRFSVISGGHSAQGYGLAQGGLTVNMRTLNRSSFHSLADGTRVVTVQSGSRFSELYHTLKQRNKGEMVVGGGCPQVALGGFVLGGGWSFLSRGYGMAVDNLISVTLILPNLTIARVSAESSDPELWWALRGGGGGNFGVAVDFTSKLHFPHTTTIGEICWPEFSGNVTLLMSQWIDQWPFMPDWLLLDPGWLPIGVNESRMFCFTVVCNNDPTQCNHWVDPLRAYNPGLDTVAVRPYVDWALQEFVNVTSGAQDGYLYVKSFVLRPEQFTVGTIEFLLEGLRQSPSPRNLILFHVGGGAINRVPANETAFPHRDSIVLLHLKAIWDTLAEQESNIQWIDALAAGLEGNYTGAYVNYIDARLQNWTTVYYGQEGYIKLLKIKKRIDPMNFFRFNQSIGSHFNG